MFENKEKSAALQCDQGAIHDMSVAHGIQADDTVPRVVCDGSVSKGYPRHIASYQWGLAVVVER